MAKEYNYEMFGHPSIHSINSRKLKVYFSEPDMGVNEDTGILLLIAGFGGSANSKVYNKMRNTFADKYNLVTVQCDYIGWEFMQSINNISLNIDKIQLERYFKKEEIDYIYKDDNFFTRLMEICSTNKINIGAKENLNESLDNYNDMGLIQAIDNISAVISVMEIIKDNGYEYNEDKFILYGHSHGAYLSYLANALAPGMFSLLIDNSSWLIPTYLKGSRYVNTSYGNSILSVEFDYLARTLDYDEEILYLPTLYGRFDNRCEIICYHGTNDNLISHKDKIELKGIINNFKYVEIDEKKVDNKIFKSTQHGLGVDFLKLFDFTMKNYVGRFSNKSNEKYKNVMYETKKNIYNVNYDNIVPILNIEGKD